MSESVNVVCLKWGDRYGAFYVNRLYDGVRRNLSRPFGAAQIASALGMPRIRLDRLFAARLGRSAGTEIARRRLARAQKLLGGTDMSLAEIASRCGYCHASFFIRTFRRATGLTPAAWRRQCVIDER